MCFGKFFGGSRRHRANAAPQGASVRPSLANVPQMSVENVRKVKSSKSIKSSNAAAAAAAASHGTFNVGNQLAPSVNTMASEARKSVAAGPGGGATSDIPASGSMVPNTSGPAGGSAGGISNGRSAKRSSWWGYLGMNKKKNSSIGSL
ncbi:uncharacterized protein LOC110184352 [Drosophila serrata]|uniref:uncharacterized protein LOC110184352 n=1 Tax=Drosophila serrata TaxID=7274 RepID=UPI000A1CF7A1|nr:uncharacterized protein LOC110184352 [Drosophila serrata]KAH8356138.1 hypothetical protein KR200_001076 [Drosophila serrata]